MFRRKIFDKLGGFDERFEHGADVDFIIQTSFYGESIYINKPYLYRRIHSENLTKENFSSGIVTMDRVNLYKKYKEYLVDSDLNRVKATLVVKTIYDFFRAFYLKKPDLMKLSIEKIFEYGYLPINYYIEHIFEIITNENLDVM
jgi:GT2 family glycosyltransferase